MTAQGSGNPESSGARPPGAPSARSIAKGEGWYLDEITCRLGPADRRFEEQHENVTIAAVVEGSFQYRSSAGAALLYPGSLLLGNAGACFECGHEHGVGDRCIAFQYEPALFEEIAASAAGTCRYRFPSAVLPALRELALPIAAFQAMARQASLLAADETAIRLVELVVGCFAGSGASTAPSPRDQRRIARALRHIEEHAEEPLDLARLAGIACMSKYHFLRVFRRSFGVTPYGYLLGLRLRRAAVHLSTTAAPVAAIAFEAGFGDLSTFNHRFREAFGASPRAFRHRYRAS